MRRVISTIIGLLAIAAVAPGAERLTLADAETQALAANPQVRAARLETLAAAQRTAEAKGRRFGELALVGDYSHFESPRLVRPMSIELFKDPAGGFAQLPWGATQTHVGVAFHVPLLAAGALKEGDRIARLSQAAAEDSAHFSRDEVRTKVRAAYRNALLAHHALATARAYREALARDEADIRLRVKVGSLPTVDTSKVTFALRGAEAQVADLAAQERTAQAFLAAFMGIELPAEGWSLADVTQEPPLPPGRAGTVEEALAKRSDLSAVRQLTLVAERKKALARDAFGPKLALEGSWLRNDSPSIDHALDSHEVSLTLKLPVFAGFTRSHALEEAKVNLEIAREHERAKELEVSTQVVDAEGRVKAARAQLAAGKAQRALGAEVARVEHLKLEQGTGRMDDYLLARAQEMQGETSYWQGLYALQNAVDYLDFVSARGGHHE